MITILNAHLRKEVTLKRDTGENPSIFIVGMLDAQERAYIQNSLKGNKTDFLVQLDLVRFGLKEWTNVGTPPMKFEVEETYFPGIGMKSAASMKCLSVLTPKDIADLGDSIIAINFVTEQAEKN